MLTIILLRLQGTIQALIYALYYTWWLLRAAFLSSKTVPWCPYNRADLPSESLAGKVILITGASSGCGEEILRCIGECLCTYDSEIDSQETRVYLFVRDLDKMQRVLDKMRREWAVTRATRLREGEEDCDVTLDEEKFGLKIILVQCDMDSFQSVRKAAVEFLVKEGGTATEPLPLVKLNVMFCNAGVCSDPYVDTKTQDGWERNMGVNTLAHHALIRYLLPALKSTTDARVVFTSTISTFWIRPVRGLTRYYFHPFNRALRDHPPRIPSVDTYTAAILHWDTTAAYARSKLASLLLTRYLVAQHHGITFTLVHPGVVRTSIFVPRTAFQQRVMDFMTFPAYTQPLRSAQKEREMGYAAVNLLYAAFALDTLHAQSAFVQEWCHVVDVDMQDQWLSWGDSEVTRELEKFQQELGLWADDLVDAV